MHPIELAHSTEFASSRRREWLAGRYCLALALDLPDRCVPLLSEEWGAPRLPKGCSGSISHKGPLTAAIASDLSSGIGIDIECVEEDDDYIATSVLTEAERARGGTSPDFAVQCFAAKEAVYKALGDPEQRDIDHLDLELLFHPNTTSWSPVRVRVRERDCLKVEAWILQRGRWVIAIAQRQH